MRISIISIFSIIALLFCGCKKPTSQQQQATTNTPPVLTDTTQVKGYNLLGKICGIWNGGVTSTTHLGSYPEWIVDFRPISAAQVGAKNELDTANNIFMSFFITYHSGYKLAFRNGGAFANLQRTSYMEVDSVSESGPQSYYRFVDFVKGAKRVYTEVIFKQDSLIIQSFTNVYNTEPAPTPHMQWRAKLKDSTSCQAAKSHFNFPQKVLVQNFDTTFASVTESIYYQNSGDPYPASAQPYVGQATLLYTSSPTFSLNPTNHVFLLVTTQPLISGFSFNTANMIYRSRYVILNASTTQYTFTLMHPGSYYLYAYYDANGNGVLDSGDYVSTANTAFTLAPASTVSASAVINYQIP